MLRFVVAVCLYYSAVAKDVSGTCGCMEGQICRIECNDLNGYCANSSVVCPTGSVECEFLCKSDGLTSLCSGKTLVCLPNVPCSVICRGDNACTNVNINAGQSHFGANPTSIPPKVICNSASPCVDNVNSRSSSCANITIMEEKVAVSELLPAVTTEQCEASWVAIGIKLEFTAAAFAGRQAELLAGEYIKTVEGSLGSLVAADKTNVSVKVVCDIDPDTNYKGSNCKTADAVTDADLLKMGGAYLDTQVSGYSDSLTPDVATINEALRYRALGRGPLIANGKKFPAPITYDNGEYTKITQTPASSGAAYDDSGAFNWDEHPAPTATDSADNGGDEGTLTVVIITAIATACTVGLIGVLVIVRGKGKAGGKTGRHGRGRVPTEANMAEMLGKEHLPFLLAAEEAEMHLEAFYLHKPFGPQSPLSARSSEHGVNNRDDCMSRSSSGASLSLICQTLQTPPRRQIVGGASR